MSTKPIRNKKTVIALCSSASFFRDVLDLERKLKTHGFSVKIPYTAGKMRASGDYRVETYKTWFKNPNSYARKTWLIKNHLKKVQSSDAVLVVNKQKHGTDGYIGGNTLIEMAIAFHYEKPIYLLHHVSSSLPIYEEVMGLNPVILNGDIKKIKK